MTFTSPSNSPVVIGGLGGSATRVYARLLRHAGFHIGADLNDACDCAWATLLLKRRYELLEDRELAAVAMGLLRRKLSTGGRMTRAERGLLWRTASEVSRHGHGYRGEGKGLWPWRTAARLALARPPRAGTHRGWGFKEPNTHVLLEQLASNIEDLRFIYVARHGLDMAFSSNIAQLHAWGPLYGVEPPAAKDAIPSAQLDYWIAATRRALELGTELLGDRFLLLRYDDLFPDPRPQLELLAGFLGVEASCFDKPGPREWTRPSSSVGRHLDHDLSMFSASQLASVQALGFRSPAPSS